MAPKKRMRFRIDPSIIEIEYVRCRNVGCKAIIMLVIDPQKNKEYAWVHVLFPGETIDCRNPMPDRAELNGT